MTMTKLSIILDAMNYFIRTYIFTFGIVLTIIAAAEKDITLLLIGVVSYTVGKILRMHHASYERMKIYKFNTLYR